jgi:nucleotide-binding universal stress UspA family protein
VDCILNAVEEDGKPALIAVGSRRLGTLDPLTLGSVSVKVIGTAVGPVLIYSQPPAGADTESAL